MKNFNIKSKNGFTLIELLVVIGILAVLAAIAIPSVAGLIDRANVSADNTNANEMTNAIERFTSEYELYCQDIASGTLNINDLDSAQGRVYNVTGAKNRKDIADLESIGLNGFKLNQDTKYPENIETLSAIVENYMKTSSSTFEPKQSDCNYYYSPDCGIVVCTETDKAKIEDLNKLVMSGKDAKGNELSTKTIWINVTTLEFVMFKHNDVVPLGGKYITSTGNTINQGENMITPSWDDIYYYGDYKYIYYYGSGGWKVELNPAVVSRNQTSYGPILTEINGKKITSLYQTFMNCTNLKIAPQIPDNVIHLHATFYNCTSLEDASNLIIPSTINNMGLNVSSHFGTFENCVSLKYAPKIPSTIQGMFSTFKNCRSLVEMPIIPNHFDKTNVFYGCTQFGY